MNNAISEAAPAPGRKLWVDALRALAMLLVVIGHQCSGKNVYFVFTSPIKLPLFFAVSGYVFGGHRKQARDFFSGLLWHLLLPWLIVCLADAILWIPRHGLTYLPGALREIALGETLWYIPCAIFAEIIHWVIRRLCPSVTAVYLACAACWAAGLGMAKLGVLDALMINRAFVAQAYMLVGFLFRAGEHRLARIRPSVIALLAVLYVLMGLVSLRVWPGKSLNVRSNRYYNLPYCLAMIWLGCGTLFLAARRLAAVPRFLAFIGQNTLVIYFFHMYALSLLRRILQALAPSLPFVVSVAVVTTLACAGCCVLAALLNRYCPIIAGRKSPPRRT